MASPSTRENHRAELNSFLQTMLTEGLINNEFLQLPSMKPTRGKDFVVSTVESHQREAKRLLTQMSNQLDTSVIDFRDILLSALDLLERSISIGIVHGNIACVDILNACFEKDIDCCKQGLTTAKEEFARLEVKFESVVKLEKNIIECEDTLEPKIETNPCESLT